MVAAVVLFLCHVDKQAGQVVGVGRASYLIIYNSQMIVCLSKIQHGLDEVLSVHAEYPCDADDVEFFHPFLYRELSLVFRLAVYVQRMTLIIRLPRAGALAVEYIVCGDVDHFAVKVMADFCDVLGSDCIDLMYFFFFVIILSKVYSGPCCTVDYDIRVCFGNDFSYAFCIGDVHFFNINADSFMTAFCKFIHDVMAELAFYTCYKYSHNGSPFSDFVIVMFCLSLVFQSDFLFVP